MLRGLGGSRGTELVPLSNGSNAPITEGDRKDGIESLSKAFQIYGLPKNDKAATEPAQNAGELYKLAANQSPERSNYILSTIVEEFRGGKLTKSDCEQAGPPLPPTPEETP